MKALTEFEACQILSKAHLEEMLLDDIAIREKMAFIGLLDMHDEKLLGTDRNGKTHTSICSVMTGAAIFKNFGKEYHGSCISHLRNRYHLLVSLSKFEGPQNDDAQR